MFLRPDLLQLIKFKLFWRVIIHDHLGTSVGSKFNLLVLNEKYQLEL